MQYPLSTVPLGYKRVTTVTPSDTVAVIAGTKAIYVGGTGDLTVRMPGASTNFTFTAVPAGTLLPISPSLVLATGTAATNIVAMG